MSNDIINEVSEQSVGQNWQTPTKCLQNHIFNELQAGKMLACNEAISILLFLSPHGIKRLMKFNSRKMYIYNFK